MDSVSDIDTTLETPIVSSVGTEILDTLVYEAGKDDGKNVTYVEDREFVDQGYEAAPEGMTGGSVLYNDKVDSFFKDTVLSSKVIQQLRNNDFHSFLFSVEAFQGEGKVEKIQGGDGIIREMLTIRGSYAGRDGTFEFIKEPNNEISHRFFKPD